MEHDGEFLRGWFIISAMNKRVLITALFALAALGGAGIYFLIQGIKPATTPPVVSPPVFLPLPTSTLGTTSSGLYSTFNLVAHIRNSGQLVLAQMPAATTASAVIESLELDSYDFNVFECDAMQISGSDEESLKTKGQLVGVDRFRTAIAAGDLLILTCEFNDFPLCRQGPLGCYLRKEYAKLSR